MTWEKFKKFHIKWRFISFFRTKAYCIVDVMVTGVQVVTSQKSQGNLMFIALSYLWPNMQSRPEIPRLKPNRVATYGMMICFVLY